MVKLGKIKACKNTWLKNRTFKAVSTIELVSERNKNEFQARLSACKLRGVIHFSLKQNGEETY